MRALSALLVAFGWIDECRGFGQAFRSTSLSSSGCARAAAARMLDIVVEPDAKPTQNIGQEDLPDYMKSKRRMYPRKCDVMDEIEYFVQQKIDDGLLLNIEKAWQPSDFLPDSEKPTEEWFDEVREIREAHAEVPDEILLVLIGDMITEEALPTYLTLLNTLEGTDDPTGAVDTAWGRWSRQWTAEENRHGDLLNRYLYLGGRCNMKSLEQTIMRLISSGFDPDTRSDPYRGFIYTSFQERATKISHGNVGKLLAGAGDPWGAKICARIAGDEARHEKAYQLFVERVLELDPDGAIISYADMMKKQIVMPAELMCDGLQNRETELYEDFARVATDLQVYTGVDYADIIEHLNDFWKIETVTGLGPEAQEAQEYLGKLPVRFRKLAQRQQRTLSKTAREPRPWPWLNNREL
jgi:acyl-[acyl-carrier-protein] desaturase